MTDQQGDPQPAPVPVVDAPIDEVATAPTDVVSADVEAARPAAGFAGEPLRTADAALAEFARHALAEVTPESSIGELLGARNVVDEVVNIEFATTLGGYVGWHWTVSVATLGDGDPNVLEVELLPFDGALLAPPWVPWADRLADYRSAHPDGVLIADDEDADETAPDDDSDDVEHDDFDDLDLDALDLDALDDEVDDDDDLLEEALGDTDESAVGASGAEAQRSDA